MPQHIVREAIAAGHLCRLHCDLGADLYHIPVDLLLAFNYLEGKAGQWLYREIGQLPFLETEFRSLPLIGDNNRLTVSAGLLVSEKVRQFVLINS
ncbi:MAG: hypothetical protein AAES65_15800 [Candidatus Thiodiazotropha sp. (ex. Lucinoma kazani)]